MNMKPTVWTEDLSVGVAELDRQHRKIIQIINRLQQNPAVSIHSELVSGIFQEVMEYIATHFASEERIMEERGYPGVEAHRQAHLAFTERLSEMMLDAMQVEDQTAEDLFRLLDDWLDEHIRSDDMDYGAFFKNQSSPD